MPKSSGDYISEINEMLLDVSPCSVVNNGRDVGLLHTVYGCQFGDGNSFFRVEPTHFSEDVEVYNSYGSS